jgi:hypothetical protein
MVPFPIPLLVEFITCSAKASAPFWLGQQVLSFLQRKEIVTMFANNYRHISKKKILAKC